MDGNKKYGELLKIVSALRNELEEAYFVLKSNFNAIENAKIFDKKAMILNNIIAEIKKMDLNADVSVPNGGGDGERAASDDVAKEKIRDEIFKIINVNKAFSELVRKNLIYNQMTISFITDEFKKAAIYNNCGRNNSNFAPLRNVLMGHGVTA